MRTEVLLIALVLLSACAAPGTPRASDGRKVLLAVPFFPDGTDQCGPSVLASVLGYWGKPAEPGDLKKEIDRAHLKGALTVDMLLAAQERGLAADVGGGGLVEVRRELDAGRPVIAFLNVGFRAYPIGHYLVITGYDDARQVIFAHSGKKRDRRIAYKTFDKAWERTERWALLIQPQS